MHKVYLDYDEGGEHGGEYSEEGWTEIQEYEGVLSC